MIVVVVEIILLERDFFVVPACFVNFGVAVCFSRVVNEMFSACGFNHNGG